MVTAMNERPKKAFPPRYLFRAKSVDDEAWIYGSVCFDNGTFMIPNVVFDEDGELVMREIFDDDGEIMLQEVIPSSVGRCTGLRDRNGTLIFYGDIVRGPISRIVYEDVDGQEIPRELEEVYSVPVLPNLAVTSLPVEITGNIHDAAAPPPEEVW